MIQGNSLKGFGWYRISCLWPGINRFCTYIAEQTADLISSEPISRIPLWQKKFYQSFFRQNVKKYSAFRIKICTYLFVSEHSASLTLFERKKNRKLQTGGPPPHPFTDMSATNSFFTRSQVRLKKITWKHRRHFGPLCLHN